MLNKTLKANPNHALNHGLRLCHGALIELPSGRLTEPNPALHFPTNLFDFMKGLFSRHRPGASKRILSELEKLRAEITDLKLMTAQLRLAAIAEKGRLARLRDAECKVYSQFGEDGIIQYLIHHCANPAPSFVEFGVEDYQEANTRFLLLNDNWCGLILDSNAEHIEKIQHSPLCWRHDLTAGCSYITRENINGLLEARGFKGEIGLLSIDIDGNDYWVWESIDVVQPAIVVIEYNNAFGAQHRISIPYQADFSRGRAHYSHQYFGASLPAFEHLGQKKGYALVGSNSAGNNAFFVRRDKLGDLTACSAAEAYVESRIRDSRDREGRLNYLSGAQRWQEMKDCEVVEVDTLRKVRIKDLSLK
jgi:hypothetical protein